MTGDRGPYMDDAGGVWVPRMVPYREAWAVASEANQEGPDQVLRYRGKVNATLVGFTPGCLCEEVCERRYRDDGDTNDRTCEVPAWAFEIVERGEP